MNLLFEIISRAKYQKQRLQNTPRYQLTKRVREFIQQTSLSPNPALPPREQKIFAKFLQHHLIEIFNYPFISKYIHRCVKVRTDKINGLHYVYTPEKHRLYFKRGMTRKNIRVAYNNLCAEQDNLSPHNYCFEYFEASNQSIFADIGAAEGIFGLKFVDEIKQLYLFEANHDWIEALEATFHPWKDKVVIINKYVGNDNNDKFVSLDYFFKNLEQPTLLKIDVEGAESAILDGANHIIENTVDDILICTYHKNGDDKKISELLQQRNYNTKFSPGYMFFMWEKPNYSLTAPFEFRKGLIHASR
ncbi:MAG: FkbM family methyltransferase [Prevotellaceae bacterium]|jgi:hypothetical protein|nr:FkbM family methyltransferase [Prevotellaceae bacterium]